MLHYIFKLNCFRKYFKSKVQKILDLDGKTYILFYYYFPQKCSHRKFREENLKNLCYGNELQDFIMMHQNHNSFKNYYDLLCCHFPDPMIQNENVASVTTSLPKKNYVSYINETAKILKLV